MIKRLFFASMIMVIVGITSVLYSYLSIGQGPPIVRLPSVFNPDFTYGLGDTISNQPKLHGYEFQYRNNTFYQGFNYLRWSPETNPIRMNYSTLTTDNALYVFLGIQVFPLGNDQYRVCGVGLNYKTSSVSDTLIYGDSVSRFVSFLTDSVSQTLGKPDSVINDTTHYPNVVNYYIKHAGVYIPDALVNHTQRIVWNNRLGVFAELLYVRHLDSTTNENVPNVFSSEVDLVIQNREYSEKKVYHDWLEFWKGVKEFVKAI